MPSESQHYYTKITRKYTQKVKLADMRTQQIQLATIYQSTSKVFKIDKCKIKNKVN